MSSCLRGGRVIEQRVSAAATAAFGGRVLAKARAANLVQQRSIADVQHLRCLPAIPIIRMQHAEDCLRLDLANQLLGARFEREALMPRQWWRGKYQGAASDVLSKRVCVSHNDVATDDIFQLPDISRPAILLQHPVNTGRKWRGVGAECLIE